MRMVSYIADRIKAGHVVGMPTDTFYGLAADPLNLRAVDLIYDVKTRNRHKPLSLLIESVEQAEYLAAWPLSDTFRAITICSEGPTRIPRRKPAKPYAFENVRAINRFCCPTTSDSTVLPWNS